LSVKLCGVLVSHLIISVLGLIDSLSVKLCGVLVSHLLLLIISVVGQIGVNEFRVFPLVQFWSSSVHSFEVRSTYRDEGGLDVLNGKVMLCGCVIYDDKD